jgi:hypothetical protein
MNGPPLKTLAESNASLWVLAASPALWALHFLGCYLFAATWCGRLGDGSLATVRTAIAVLTVLALAGIVAVGVVGYRWHAAAPGPVPHDADTPEDRRGFMGMSTLLLSGLSGIGVVYSALAAVFIGTCE